MPLVWLYLAAHLWAFWRLRVTPLYGLRLVCLVMRLRAVTVLAWPLLPWTREQWWHSAWAILQPVELLACACLVAEVAYFAMFLLLPGEYGALLKLLSVSGLIAVVAALHPAPDLTVFSQLALVPGYLYTWGAVFLTIMEVCLTIVKPTRMDSFTRRYLSIAAAYLWVWAISDLLYPAVRQGSSAYWAVNHGSLVALSLCLIAFGVALPRAARH